MSDEVLVTEADFDVGAEIACLGKGHTDIGAVASFTGRVRLEDGLTALRIEHYPAMTVPEIERHVAEAQQRWDLIAVRVIHRVGRLLPGDNIVFVATASGHRRDAFEAAEFLMDYLKTSAPFWKFEERPGSNAAGGDWVAARASDDDAVKRWR